MTFTPEPRRFFIVMISIHGLVRGNNLELGRDADTGGQVKYVVELARSLGLRSDVDKVVLLTRCVWDESVSPDYSQVEEPLSDKVSIVRIECGERKYLRKELLWDCLETFSDNAYDYLKRSGRRPDIVHGHYADAGYVGARLSHQFGIPLVFTGHSLGRNKRNQLIASGVKLDEIEATYNISRRIEAEETTLSVAQCIITSTQQEIESQYGLYDFCQPEIMRVIPPGMDLSKFYPPQGHESNHEIKKELSRFLDDPNKPMILAVARPDPKKNFDSLIRAFGESHALQEKANLVLIAGNRDDISSMEEVPRVAINRILLGIDRYDLYGKVAYPKHHTHSDIPILYRMAAESRGLFVNPALTEPFGLTLIEAAACGLPIIATEDGGPIDIVRNCQNGYLVNPLDDKLLAERMLSTLSSKDDWLRLSKNGIERVGIHYSWSSHVEKYLDVIAPLISANKPIAKKETVRRTGTGRKQALITSLDLNLIGDTQQLQQLLEILSTHRKSIIFGIATGRRLENAVSILRNYRIPLPDILITGQGTEIHYSSYLTEDKMWQRHINHLWDAPEVLDALQGVPGLQLQPPGEQSRFQVSFFIDPQVIGVSEVRQILQRRDLTVNLVNSFGRFLDVLPARASKGLALRWCAEHFDFPLANTLVAGVTGADKDMLMGNTLGSVVESQHRDELSSLANGEKIYFSNAMNAEGIIEAMRYYGFPLSRGRE